jgi:signal peptidase
MEPTFQPNDIVVVDFDFGFEDVNVGDIIVFERPEGRDRTIIHRVISIDHDADGNRVLTTKGDGNPLPIPGTDYPITEDLYIGKADYSIPKLGFITRFFAPPVNYIISIAVWAAIIYALYKRWKQQKPIESGKETSMQPQEVHDATEKVAGKNRLTIKSVMPSQKIIAEGGRDFKWSWLIITIIFAWPAAIAYYFSSKRNSMTVTISPKSEGQGSVVSVHSMGRKGSLAARELNSTI